jgi:transcriptional regulator
MYVPPPFQTDRATSLAFAAARGFGLVVACDGGRPLASPLPFHLSYTDDGTPCVAFHVARGNVLAEAAAKGGTWMISVIGADTYVSPDWYASPDQVPTWLYMAAQLAGPVRRMTDDELVRHLDELSEKFEARLAPKPIWTADKVSPARRKMLHKAIAGMVMNVEEISGSFKLNQHKSDADHTAVASTLAAGGDTAGKLLAQRMMALRPELTYEPAGFAG